MCVCSAHLEQDKHQNDECLFYLACFACKKKTLLAAVMNTTNVERTKTGNHLRTLKNVSCITLLYI